MMLGMLTVEMSPTDRVSFPKILNRIVMYAWHSPRKCCDVSSFPGQFSQSGKKSCQPCAESMQDGCGQYVAMSAI